MVAAAAVGACNFITGASELEVEEDGTSGAGASVGSGPTGSGPSTGSGASCGDATCSPGEDCVTCAGDCGACAATCADGTCQPDETCVSCPQDCGTCAAVCGNATCEASETCVSCEADCGACADTCGDATCQASETCQSCPQDCGACATCGDGTCNAGETCTTCPGDCGMCGPMCGDAMCNGAETCDTCASDCGACSTCGGASDATTTLDAEEQAFLGLINSYRASNGLGALAACTSLNRAAQGHSEDMRDNNYFSHTGLNGSSPWDRACDACYDLGCGPQTAMAENIAAGNSGAQATFDQWQNSPGHNANMLGSSFTQLGIGRATGGGQYGVYWTNVFGGASEPSCN